MHMMEDETDVYINEPDVHTLTWLHRKSNAEWEKKWETEWGP